MLVRYDAFRPKIDAAIKVRHSLARKFGKPIIMLETVSHSGYLLAVWSEGHFLLSLFAGGTLVAILASVALGAE